MKLCKECNNPIGNEVVINGKTRSLRNRTRCLVCVPYGKSPYSKRYTKKEKLSVAAAKQRAWTAQYFAIHGIYPQNERCKKRKRELVEALGGKCQICPYDRCLRNLVFHHLSNKIFELSERAFQFSWKRIISEARKCVLLCANCHGEVHDGTKHPMESANQKVHEILTDWKPSDCL